MSETKPKQRLLSVRVDEETARLFKTRCVSVYNETATQTLRGYVEMIARNQECSEYIAHKEQEQLAS